ncbi:MAG: hypothetical protein LBT88_08145 [Oscillospiraceae bacterium]|jgi:hypothetical protein|nr:hypothetical protein [Oscillospiraceae bacterium]
MTKTIKTLARGEKFNFAGYDWIALDDVQDGDAGRICLMAGVLPDRLPFDENNCNSWMGSTIRAELNGFFKGLISTAADPYALLPYTGDYITGDGDKVFLLSEKEYIRNSDVIPNVTAYWWLRSPCADNSDYAGIVYTVGYVYNYDVTYYYAACPAIYLALDTEVSVDGTEPVTNIKIPSGGIGELRDGYHTFNELYHHRAVLFSVVCASHKDYAWKSKKHDDGTMYDGMFIVGVYTPDGVATYHYDIDPYWDIFEVPEREFAPKWDGHTPADAIARIASLAKRKNRA